MEYFILGFIVGYIFRTVLLVKSLIDNNIKNNQPKKADQSVSISAYAVYVKDSWFIYRSDNHQFLSQGSTTEQAATNLKNNYPHDDFIVTIEK